jgi:hypothetical protein
MAELLGLPGKKSAAAQYGLAPWRLEVARKA